MLRYLYVVLVATVLSTGLSAWAKAPEHPVDLNHAKVSDLMQLPGVGKSRAAAILEARTKRPFRRVQDLLRVRGFGTKRFLQVKPYVVVTP